MLSYWENKEDTLEIVKAVCPTYFRNNSLMTFEITLIVVQAMLIGSCRDCSEICCETSRTSFDKIHEDKKHIIFPMNDFIDSNEAFISKVQRTWKTFDLNVQHFFKNLHSKLEKIEKDVYERIIEEELKTAVNSNDKRVIQLARSVLNEKFKNLTCRDIEEFVEIKKRQEDNPNFLYIHKKEEDFAFDILDEIKRTAYDIGKNLYDSKGKHQKQAQIPRPAPKQEPPKRQQERMREEPARRQPYKIVEKKEAAREEKREERPERERRQERMPRQARPPRQERRQRQDRQPRQERRPRQDRQRRQPTRQDRPPRQQRQDRKPRQERPARQERRPREDWPTREDRPPRQERAQRQDRQHRQERLPRQSRQERPQRADHKRMPRRDNNQGRQNDKQQKTFKKVKISELKQSDDELSLDLKLISFVKNVKERDVWLVGDQTGQIKLIIPNHESFKPGVAITLNNCYVKEFHGQLQLNAKLFSTITSAALGKDVDVGSLQKELREKPQRRRQTGPVAITKISSIQPGLQDMKIIAKVLSVKIKGQVAECVLGDDTGLVNARFKASEFLKEGNSIYCRGISSDIDGTVQGKIYLSQGSRFLIQNAREGVRKVNKELNISLRVYAVESDQ